MTRASSILRVAKAIALGSAAASAITTLGLAIFNLSSASAYSYDAPLAYLAWLALSFLVTSAVAATLGLGWHILCQRIGLTSVHAYWIAGAMVGAVPGALWLLPSGSFLIAAIIPYGAVLGGLTGLFAWLIRRPDRDATNPTTSSP